jgi:dimethylhistidine N-methyltransferase
MTRTLAGTVRFYDRQPKPQDLGAEAIAGLSRQPKALAPKYFYDERGSALFGRICETPEYYLTRAEIEILRARSGALRELIGRQCLLIEPGSGNSRKVRELLAPLRPRAYFPIDISRASLYRAAMDLAADYPWLEIHAVCADFTASLDLPVVAAGTRRVVFFPGSSIGNFTPEESVMFLTAIARLVGAGGGLLIGVDLKKDHGLLDAAYNDAAGLTAAFNRNVLARLNRELGCKFDLEAFAHRAFYDAEKGRIEMHLVSLRDQLVVVQGRRFFFRTGETIHTENSYKYTIAEFQALGRRAGFSPQAVWTDNAGLFSVHHFVYGKA